MKPSPHDTQYLGLALKCLKKAEYPSIDGEEVLSIAQCMAHLQGLKKKMEDEMMGPKEVKKVEDKVKTDKAKPSGTKSRK